MEPALNKPAIASIGSTHPWNIAGVGLDALVAHVWRVRSLSVITGVTAQDETGVHARFAIPARVVRAQLDALPLDDVGALRIGAIPSEANVAEVARFLRANPGIPAVVDPVVDASLGGALSAKSAYAALRKSILPLPVVLTPNIPEAARLLGHTIGNYDAALLAARSLRAMGPRAVLLKGAHHNGDVYDVLVSESETTVFRDTRLTHDMRGAGCTLAAALACELALGTQLATAVARARKFVRKKIEAQLAFRSLHVAF